MIRLNLYKSSSEGNRLDKTNFIEFYLTLKGELKSATSIINPVILIEFSDFHSDEIVDDDHILVTSEFGRIAITDKIGELLSCNYAHIPEFGRYYFITDIISVRNNLWEIHMSVDVLMSFKDKILQQEGIIDRNEFEFDEYLVDDLIPCNSNYTNVIINLQEYKDRFNRDMGVFYENNGAVYEDFLNNFLVAINVAPIKNLPEALFTPNYFYNPNQTNANTTYLITYSNFNNLIDRFLAPDAEESLVDKYSNLSDFIKYIKILPFSYNQFCKLAGGDLDSEFPNERTGYSLTEFDGTMPFGGLSIECSGWYLTNAAQLYMTLSLDKSFLLNSFLDFKPYTTVRCYLPLLGFVEIDCKLLKDGYDKLVIIIDPNDFSCVVYQSNKKYVNNKFILDSNDNFFELFKFDIGIDYGIGRTNANQRHLNNAVRKITKNNETKKLVVNTLTGGFSSATSIVGGRRSYIYQNEYRGLNAYENAVSGATSTAGNLINNYMDINTNYKIAGLTGNIHEYQFTSNNDSVTSIVYDKYDNPYITIQRVAFFYPKNYNNIYGKPLWRYKKFNEVYGFTTIGEVHLINFDTSLIEEIKSINDLLSNGVYFPNPPNQ